MLEKKKRELNWFTVYWQLDQKSSKLETIKKLVTIRKLGKQKNKRRQQNIVYKTKTPTTYYLPAAWKYFLLCTKSIENNVK